MKGYGQDFATLDAALAGGPDAIYWISNAASEDSRWFTGEILDRLAVDAVAPKLFHVLHNIATKEPERSAS